MNWFYLALIGPTLWSLSNHIDKFIVTRYFKEGGIGAILFFTCIVEILVTPIIAFFVPGVLHMPTLQSIVLLFLGALGMVQLLIYFLALNEDNTSVVVPLFQIMPITTYILSYFILGEQLTTKEIIGGLIIISGAMLLSFDLTGEKPRLKMKILGLMIFNCLLGSTSSVIFKLIALQESFWISTFWTYLGAGLFGVILFVGVQKYRNQFLHFIKMVGPKGLSLNAFNETISLIGFITFSYATLLAPIALVQLINGFQPIIVLIFGILISFFYPQYGSEILSRKHLTHKIIAIGIIFVGTYFLTF